MSARTGQQNDALKGRTVEDLLILDPLYILNQHYKGGCTLTPAQIQQALTNLDQTEED